MENDSFEEPLTKAEAVREGLRIGATFLFMCMDHTGEVEPIFCMPGECSGTVEKSLWRSSYHVDTIDLDDIRQQESLE